MNPKHLLNELLDELRANHPHLLASPDGVLVISHEDAGQIAAGGDPPLKVGKLSILCLPREHAIAMLRVAGGEAWVRDFTAIRVDPGFMPLVYVAKSHIAFAVFPRGVLDGTRFRTWAERALRVGLPAMMARYPHLARDQQTTHLIAMIAPDSLLGRLLPAAATTRLAGVEAAGAPVAVGEVIAALLETPKEVLSDADRTTILRDLRANMEKLPPGHVTIFACRGKSVAIGAVAWEAPCYGSATAGPKPNAPGGSA